jgi:hypothetical protein
VKDLVKLGYYLYVISLLDTSDATAARYREDVDGATAAKVRNVGGDAAGDADNAVGSAALADEDIGCATVASSREDVGVAIVAKVHRIDHGTLNSPSFHVIYIAYSHSSF